MGLTLLSGFTGTMLFFFGLRSSLGLLADRTGRREKLHAFTFRQLQENVIHRSHSLAISSLLILAALCCFGAGVAIAQFYKDSEQHVLDYTFPCAAVSYTHLDVYKRQAFARMGMDGEKRTFGTL